MNGSQSGMPSELRISAVTGTSCTGFGIFKSLSPASCGRRFPFGIDRLAGPNAVFPGIAPAARTRHHVINAACLRLEQRACVLAAISIAVADGPGAELGTLLWDARKVGQHDDRRHADRAANR